VNFLAHVYLSGDHTELAIGNLIADRVKGKNMDWLPLEMQKGVLLHRAIDQFTDQHPLFKGCVSLLFPKYRHYSRVLVDMYFDHFLAVHWKQFHKIPLQDYANSFYQKLQEAAVDFPEPLQKFSNALILHNWFAQYQTISGLRMILKQMEQRTRFPSNLAASTKDLEENYSYFEGQFFEFMSALISFTKTKTITL